MEIKTPKFCFLEDKFIPWEDGKVPITTHALHYGTAVFGGLRGYWNEEEHQLYVFRIRDHFERLHDSTKLVLIDLKYSVDELITITRELLRKNEFKADVYIRPLAFKSVAPKIIGLDITQVPSSFLMFAFEFGEYLPLTGGLSVCTSTWRRIPDLVIPARGKISGGYINASLAKAEATLSGFSDAIFLTEDGYVSEGSAANLFIVRKGILVTPPVYADILEGIVRRSLLQVAADLGIPTEVRPIQRSELYVSDEIFFCGTGVQLAPIAKVDYRTIKNPDMPVTKKMQEEFFAIIRGKRKKYKEWLTPIYE